MYQPREFTVSNIPIQQRRATNLKWLIVFAVAVLVLIPFLLYCLIKSDLNKNMQDNCGNICGQKNSGNGKDCSGQDMTQRPYILVNGSSRECVSSCSDGMDGSNSKCILAVHYSSSLHPAMEFLNKVKWQMVICGLLTILVSMSILILIRHAAGCLVWSLILVSLAACLLVIVGLWIFPSEHNGGSMLYANIFLTVMWLAFCLLVYFWRSKISLLIILINEAGKFIFEIPHLMILPIVVFVVSLIINVIFFLSTYALINYNSEARNNPDIDQTIWNNLVTFTGIYNGFIVLWLNTFLYGVNFMIISGAVSHWYFNRQNRYAQYPLKISLINTFKFHLGNGALGSLILVPLLIVNIIFAIINRRVKKACSCFCNYLERFVRLFIRNSYILTGIHGEPFLQSGRKAVNILLQHLENIISIYYIGNYIFAMIHLLTIAIVLALSAAVVALMPLEDNLTYTIYLTAGIMALAASSITLGVVRNAVDTLLLCYCVDVDINRSMSKPLLASNNLMQFMDSSKKI